MEGVSGHTETQGVGSTKRLPKKARSWLMTWFDYPEDYCEKIDTETQRHVLQLEVCPTTGRKHVQAGFRFDNARSLDQLKVKFPGAHLEMARSWQHVIGYCRKDRTAVPGTQRTNIAGKRVCPDPLNGKKLYPWQADVVKLVSEYKEIEDRRLHWIWSDGGAKGKTSLAHHLLIRFPKEILYVNGAAKDCLYAAAEASTENDIRAVLYACPRQTRPGDIDYSALESLCDGLFFSSKYKSGMTQIPPCHVLVLANTVPVKNALSEDRWAMRCIDEDGATGSPQDEAVGCSAPRQAAERCSHPPASK